MQNMVGGGAVPGRLAPDAVAVERRRAVEAAAVRELAEIADRVGVAFVRRWARDHVQCESCGTARPFDRPCPSCRGRR